MKKPISLFLLFLSASFICGAAEFNFSPVVLQFPEVPPEMINASVREKMAFKPTDTLTYPFIGNFKKGAPIVLQKRNHRNPWASPMSLLEQFIFTYSSDDNSEIAKLFDKNLSAEAKKYYDEIPNNPDFAGIVSGKKGISVLGYLIWYEKCVLFFNVEGESKPIRFVFTFSDNRWYLGDQVQVPCTVCTNIKAFYAVYGGNNSRDMKIREPNSKEKIAILKKSAQVGFYEKLAKHHGWPTSNEMIVVE